jgi:hypothetical protein
MDVPRSWSVSIGILLWADRDAQFAGHVEYVGNESADWKMPEIFLQSLGCLAIESGCSDAPLCAAAKPGIPQASNRELSIPVKDSGANSMLRLLASRLEHPL